MALEFLEAEYVTIQHYGVEIDTLRYNGEALNDFRNQRSTVRGQRTRRRCQRSSVSAVTRRLIRSGLGSSRARTASTARSAGRISDTASVPSQARDLASHHGWHPRMSATSAPFWNPTG